MTTFTDQLDEDSRVIAFRPILVQVTGSLASGVLLSQLIYWHKVMFGREFYKTNNELMQETGLTLTELKSAKKRLIERKFVSTKLRRNPATTHYEIDEDAILKAFPSWRESYQLDESSKQESYQPVGGNPTNQLAGIRPTLHTENTNKITKQITPVAIEAEKKWETVMDHLEAGMLPDVFKTWFAPTVGMIVRPDRLLVGVPNRYYKKCLEENFKSKIRDALKEVGGYESPPSPEFQIMSG